MWAIHIAVGIAGAAVATGTLLSAVRTAVLPRGVSALLSRAVFTGVRWVFLLRLGRAASYERRDKVFASYAPISLLVLLQAWLLGNLIGFAGVHWALGHMGWRRAFDVSGSSLFTLGFIAPHGGPETAVTFFEAGIGMLLVALLISYLPAIYNAFSRREVVVAQLHVRAGTPPSGTELIRRAWTIGRKDTLSVTWSTAEVWFTELQETHTSFPSLVFFRSPQPEHSWITAAGATLDAAALLSSTVDKPREAEPQLCLRAGTLALREIARYYRVPFDPDPAPTDPITISRAEWEAAADELAASGVPVRADRDQAWIDFSGWRVNYDRVLVVLAGITMAPYAPWSSDRSVATQPTMGMRPRARH
jgi:hypothetical protein